MKKIGHYLSAILAVGFIVLLILDNHTAYTGAAEGIRLCIEVIIPSLFPFFVISNYLCNTIMGRHIPGIDIIGKRLALPAGCPSMIAVGLLGGYPVGAQLIADAYRADRLDKQTANILLGYCNNCGPAFIFGVIGSLFSSLRITVMLWIIHILSALTTGYLLPRPTQSTKIVQKKNTGSLVQSLQKSIFACAYVCGWVIIFRILISYLTQLLEGILCPLYLTVLSGLLELSNGCIQLYNIEIEAVRFVISSLFLNFGGICVMLQTASVTGSLGLGLYIPGKLLQSCISLLLSLFFLPVLFQQPGISVLWRGILSLIIIVVIYLLKNYCKNRCRNMEYVHV